MYRGRFRAHVHILALLSRVLTDYPFDFTLLLAVSLISSVFLTLLASCSVSFSERLMTLELSALATVGP